MSSIDKKVVKYLFKSRMNQFKTILNSYKAKEELKNAILFWDGCKIEMSHGNPSDGFKFLFKPNSKRLEEIIYFYKNWKFEYKAVLRGEDFYIMEEVYEHITGRKSIQRRYCI